MTSCRLNQVSLSLKPIVVFSSFARSSKSLMRFISMMLLKSEFLRMLSQFFFSSMVRTAQPACAMRLLPIVFCLTSRVFGELTRKLETN